MRSKFIKYSLKLKATARMPSKHGTLAEIYTNQDPYDAAIGIYRRPQQRKSQQAEEYEGKIRELIQKRR